MTEKSKEKQKASMEARTTEQVAAATEKWKASWNARTLEQVAATRKKQKASQKASWSARTPEQVDATRKKKSDLQIKKSNLEKWKHRQELSALYGNTYEESNVLLSNVREMFDRLETPHKNRLE